MVPELWQDAAITSLFGINVYTFGLYVAAGIVAFALVVGVLSFLHRCEKGTAPLTVLLGLVFGALFSRLFFCLMNQELGQIMPLSSWLQINGGGWSMMGALAGTFFGTFLAAKITKQKPGTLMDLAVCGFPLFVLAERLGEHLMTDFDVSRTLTTTFLQNTFLVVTDDYGSYLATYYVAAIAAGILLVILLIDLTRSPRGGDTALLFLLLFGAGSVILESLRYDRYLSITFVGLQHICAMLILYIGVLISAFRVKQRHHRLRFWSLVSLPLVVGACVGLEFALDRTDFSPVLIYVAYAAVLTVPVLFGLRLRKAAHRLV